MQNAQNQLMHMLEEQPVNLWAMKAECQNQLVYMLEEEPLNLYVMNAECSKSAYAHA